MFDILHHRKSRISSTEWIKIPWHDPAFSRRMLAEHLTQAHNHASRRGSIVDQHVTWIHHKILKQRPAKILDLGCGPGLYTSRLSACGHTCKGIDISPASIQYANEKYPHIEHILGDMRDLDETEAYDFVMLTYGEFNAFSPDDAEHILQRVHNALKPDGLFLMEVHPYYVIYGIGEEGTSWYTAEKGLFSDKPHLCLVESSFVIDRAISHYYVDKGDGELTQYTTMHYAYADDEYRHLLRQFQFVHLYPALTGAAQTEDLFVFVATK